MTVGQKKLHIEDKSLIRAMASMGGGVASSGGPCGALLGGVAFLGSVLGKEEPETKDNPVMWKSCFEFYKRFEDEVAVKWGSVNCRDITGVDWKKRDQVKNFYKGKGRITCAENTGKAAMILGEIMEKYLNQSEYHRLV